MFTEWLNHVAKNPALDLFRKRLLTISGAIRLFTTTLTRRLQTGFATGNALRNFVQKLFEALDELESAWQKPYLCRFASCRIGLAAFLHAR